MRGVIVSLFLSIIFQVHANGYCIGKFELINNMILVEAEVEENLGYFIVDTGSPNLVLNQQYFQGEKSDYMAQGINGSTNVMKRLVRKFEWGCVKKKNFTVYTVNLQHFEEAIGKPFFGLIGYEILKQKELLIDYKNLKIEQHQLSKSDLHRMEDPSQEIRFRMSLHTPILNLDLENQSVKFILDTGSEDNILDNAYVSSDYKVTDLKFLVGVGQKSSLARVVVIPNASLTDIAIDNQEYLVTNIEKSTAQGILGSPALKELNKFSINYRKKRIYVWAE
ncbi:MAG: aspartyl protease family protein [Bacteroidota bacterium]